MQDSPYLLEVEAAVRLKTKRAYLKVLLEERFGALPADWWDRLAGVTDLDQLDQLFRAAVRVNRLEDLPL
jgi:hypothetical protein